ncbi:ECF transporter S component [Brachybacterium sp. AOP25-B2-12]
MTTTSTERTAPPSSRGAGLASRPLLKYRTIDLVVTVAIGVAFGVAFLGYGQLYTLLDPLFAAFRPLVGLLTGFWFLPAIVAALVVRRPGAALLAELIAACLEALLGGHWGFGTLVSGFLQGGGVELAFLLTAYRRFTLPVAMLGGVLAAAFEWVYERFAYYPEFSTFFGLMLLVFFLVSGIVLAGVVGWALTRALARTGALDAFPAGTERAEERLV